MVSFIDKLIQELVEKQKGDYSNCCVVFPTRRACVIFKNQLIGKLNGASWLPSVYSISDLVARQSPFKIIQRPALLLKLFPVYKQHYTSSNFQSFIGWGEMMLKDFDEMDRYLIDKELLFTGMQKIKEIDAEFQFTAEESSFYSEFWKNFSNREISTSRETFLKTWQTLPKIYDDFQKSLTSSAVNYEGYVYRLIATDPEKYLDSLNYRSYYFAGFYALSSAEERVLQYFIDKRHASVYWDADDYYFSNTRQEAGKFIRESGLKIPDFRWSGHYFEETKKSIEIIGNRGNTAIAGHCGVIIEKLLNNNSSENNTAIVLPDESMLMPVLQNLPSSIQNLNITMGFPLRNHVFYSFCSSIKRLNEAKKIKGNNTMLLCTLLRELLSHSVFKEFALTISEFLLDRFEKIRSPYINLNMLLNSIDKIETNDEEKNFVRLILEVPTGVEQTKRYLEKIISILAKKEPAALPGKFGNENLLQHVYLTYLSYLEEIADDLNGFDDVSVWMVLGDFVEKLKLPFSGEPVNGLQLMGFLETRVLDFETLIITNVNEKVLPSDSSHNSFIPFSIRKAFRLPTYSNHDAIFAYHFFRLMQRASKVYLLYNTEVNTAGGEISRFILQIVYELQQRFSKSISVNHQIVSEGIAIYKQAGIKIERTTQLTERLYSLFNYAPTGAEPLKKFTPSAINTYIHCPFKFYLHYVKGLREDESVDETMQANEFGNVLHKALEVLLMPFKGKIITANDINPLVTLVEKQIAEAIKTEYDEFYVSEGENYLLERVLVELVNKILKEDIDYVPFTLIDLEGEFSRKVLLNENLSVKLAGKFDRVDEKNGVIRIIDYKTGKADLGKEVVPDDLFINSKHKVNLQLLVYNELAQHYFPGKKVVCGIAAMRHFTGGIQFLSETGVISKTDTDDFYAQLKELFLHIITESKFEQTTEIKKCDYCGFKRICNR